MTPLDWAPFNIARRADARERRRAVCLRDKFRAQRYRVRGRKGAAGSLSTRPGLSVFTLGQGLPRFSGWTGVERRWSAQRLRLSQAL